MKFLIMDEFTARDIEERSAGGDDVLIPRLITGGPDAGSYALPLSSLDNPEFDNLRDALLTCVELDGNPETMFPEVDPEPDEPDPEE
jgi:hypothetical protein